VTAAQLAEIFTALASRGAENLNLVTGTHFAPWISDAVAIAKARGCTIPVVWNSSGYESAEGLDTIERFADVYLPDLKTLDRGIARKLFRAPDYPEVAISAITRMARNGPPIIDPRGVLRKGTIVRHLVLPGLLENSRRVLEWYKEHLDGRAMLSVMTQYLPTPSAAREDMPSRVVEDAEYYQVISMLEELEIDDGFIQEPVPDSPWMPDFDAENPFPADFSTVAWHWRAGFSEITSSSR
jgi:putative pyruvate formate lyase activating enzyme